MNTLLIGPRGSGKTSLGRDLAVALGHRFVDLDAVVLAGFPEATVQAVWTAHGEPAWRAAEVEAVTTTLRSDGQVIALGGGTPIVPGARVAIEAARADGRARVVYLRCTVEALERRLAGGAGDRPSLTGDDPVAEIGRVLHAREPGYLALSDVVILIEAAESVATTLARVQRAITPPGDDPGPASKSR